MSANQRIPWPWNAPRFTSMWNQAYTEFAMNNDSTRPLYRYSQPLTAGTYATTAARGGYAYRMPCPWTQTNPSTPGHLQTCGNVTHQPACANYHSRSTPVEPKESIQCHAPGLTSDALEKLKRSGKRSRHISESDDITPTASKPRWSPTVKGSKDAVPSTSSKVSTDNKSGVSNQPGSTRPNEDNYNVCTMDLCASDDGQNSTTASQDVKSNDGEQSGGQSQPPENADLFKREWILTGLGREKEKRHVRGFEFSVLSYNLLAQGLLDTNMDLYSHCPLDLLAWNYRKQKLLKEIKDLNPDIMCLQEVEEDPFNNFFQPQLAILGYDGIYKKRTGDKHDGCAIFYRNSLFRLIKHKLVEYHKPGVFPLDRDNVGTVVLLQPLSKKKRYQAVCVATTHLLFNPKRGDVKLAQLGILFAEIDNMACRKVVRGGDAKYYPVILCGDLNSQPYSPLYKFINKGKLKYDYLHRTAVSGQFDGPHWGHLLRPLWSPKMGVTDRCQYVNTVDTRGGKWDRGGQDAADSDSGEWEDVPSSNGHKYGFKDTIRHSYHLKSVYKHRTPDNQHEVTSNHQRTNCTVDYIFYSVRDAARDASHRQSGYHSQRPEGKLKQLARLSLFSDSQASLMGGLPNGRLSSDHFSLMAKFLLEAD